MKASTERDLVEQAFAAFAEEVAQTPPMSLRAGAAIDDYTEPPAFDSSVDLHTDTYLEQYHWGLFHLEPASWRHYLPYFVQFSLRQRLTGSLAVDTFLATLRPPDRDPPRLAALNPIQESAVAAFLDEIAFGQQSSHQAAAMQAIEEWWGPQPLYRTPRA